ncbi:beta-ketoacyl synthase N-terminal-like domain-containing protein [Tundrisphaera lichenicola]|uniref:beta-ketoacyl synthase N-terminal-like domain-containing protein n=1 Tax=Tundrisphaera lichenicola TaxID=2029860 RepID=UPI003EBCDE7C
MSRRRPLDIAIVGMACRFPGARSLFEYWENILGGVDSTSDVPTDRWDPAVFFDPDSEANDRVPCRRGGYLDQPVEFDPASFGIMPNAVDGGEPEQFLVLDAARSALIDAGLPEGVADGRKVEVVIGRGNYFNRGNLTRLQHGRIVAQTLAVLEALHPEWSEADRLALRLDLKASLPPFGPATVPGQLTNATAGRVSNRLGLTGPSYVVDAASASSLVALDLGARSLVERRSDLALVGGVYLEADVDFPMVFRQLGALSKSGRSMPFGAGADGMLSGEGVGVVVLKRRADAERDGDRIYAVLQGVGLASDGRGLGLAAPSAKGHARSIRRACRAAGIDPSSVGLIEGHGLGVPAADLAELRALRAVFPPTVPGRRVLGAVSSMIGHAMPAAGIAGLIKTALAIHHRVLPPTIHSENPHPLLKRSDSPLTLNPSARPWIHGDPSTPRRAGVNAFGFAGINAHAILEEHAGSEEPDSPGAMLRWDSEAFLLAAPDRPALADLCRLVLRWLREHPEATLKDVAYTLATSRLDHPARLGLVAKSADELIDRLEAALKKLDAPECRTIRDARGAYYREPVGHGPPRIAFLFPGEGSQYPGMLADLCPHFPEVRALFDTSDRLAREGGDSTWPSEHLFGRKPDQDPALWSAGVAVNVVLSAQWALYQLLIRLGLRPDAVIGHSSGELLALGAAGVIEVDRSFEDRLGELGAVFGKLESSGTLPKARLIAVAADRARVESILDGLDGVEVAMDNCPHQVVLAGEPGAAEVAVGRLREAGLASEDLPFARAYHTPGFAPAMGPIESFFGQLAMNRPRVEIYSCASESRMPEDPEAIRSLAVEQWTKAVGFRRAIESMHSDGLGIFVDVGARGNLAGFVEDTLRGRPSFTVAANMPRRSGTLQLNHLVASLFAQGVNLEPGHLYARRRPEVVDFTEPPRVNRPRPSLAIGFPTMSVSGEIVERLQSKKPGRNGHHHEWNAPGEKSSSTNPGASPSSPSLKESAPIGLSTEDEIDSIPGQTATAAHPEPFVMEAEVRDFGTTDVDSAMLVFQETMNDFLETQRAVMDAFLGHPSPVEEAWSPLNGQDSRVSSVNPPRQGLPGPWSGDLISMVEGVECVSRIILDASDDPVAEHHTLGGRRISALHPDWRGLPVLPFSVMAEILAEVGAGLSPGKTLVAIREVRAHKWIRYEDEPVELEVRAHVLPDRPGSVFVSIHNRGLARAPRPVEAAVFDGVAVFDDHRPASPIASPFRLEDPVCCRFTSETIYAEQWLFHGPTLQAVVGIGPISMGGIEGTLRVLPLAELLREGQDAAGLLTDPIILDNFTHLLGGWGLDRLADDGDVIFPLGMEELAIFGEPPPEGTEVACRVSILERERHRVRVEAEIIRPDGRVWMSIGGWEDWRFHWPGRYRDGFRQPDRTFLGEPLDVEGRSDLSAVWLEPPGDMGRPVWRDVLEHVQLGPDERSSYLALRGPDQRRTHRLWGRIAAKEAARRLWQAEGRPPTYPGDLIVEPDSLGRPSLRSRLDPSRIDLPSISIAHVDGVAVALASLDPRARLGIDVEPIVERSGGFESTAFLPGEIELLGGRSGADRAEWVARLWCAKEATAKATGLGFIDGPSGVEVVQVGRDGVLVVRLRGGLASSCPDLSGFPIRVTTARRGDRIWAWTLGERIDR